MTAPARQGVIESLRDSVAPFISFFNGPIWARNGEPGMANFAVGNPQDMPLPGYVAALRDKVEPQSPDWFAYKLSEPGSQAVVAASLTQRTGLDWDPADVAMTNGGFGALAVAFRAILEPGDEVVFPTPPWFFYELLIMAAGGTAVRVALPPPSFDLDVEAISAAITPRTRAVLVNTPHNPSGRIFPIEDLRRLGAALEDASARHGHPIYLVSDEPYNRIVFDGRTFHSPAEVYRFTITTYSFGKTLLAPGQRVGYLAVPPGLPEAPELMDAIDSLQIAGGWLFPNAVMQHAVPDLERLSIDIEALQAKRDRLVGALREMGYEVASPEGTFYLWPRSPVPDDEAFVAALERRGVLVMPGTLFETPGWFRICLTATAETIEAAIPHFRAAIDEARREGPTHV